LILAQNADFTNGNLIQKEGGSAKVNAVALSGAPAIMTGLDWFPTPGVQRRVIYTADGKLYKDDMSGAFGTTLKSGLGANRITHMVEGGSESAGAARKLFVLTGANPVQVLAADGIVTADITTPPVDWTGGNQPSFMFPFRGVMIAGGNANNPHQVYASLADNHENFLDAGTFTLLIYPGEGHRMVAGLTAFGKAFVWKFPTGIYYINDSAAAVTGWFAQPASRQYGAAPTPHSVAQMDEAIVAFVSNTGSIILMQESSGTLTGVASTDLTKTLNLRDVIRQNFNLGRLDRLHLRWYDEKKQLHMTQSRLGTTEQGARLVIDFNAERARAEITTKDVNEALWLELDAERIPRLVSGDNAGFVWRLDQQDRNVGGLAYPFSIQTAPTDFSDVDPRYMGLKRFRRLHMEFEPTGTFDLAVQIFVDGVSKGTVLFNMGSAGAILPFDLPGILGGAELRRRTRYIVGEGHYFSMQITDTGVNNTPRLSRAYAEFDIEGVSR